MIRRTSALVSMAAVLAGCYASPPPNLDVALPHLIALLQDANPELRQTAALSLGKIAPPHATTSLVAALRDAHPRVRQYSAWALGNIGDPASKKAAPALVRLLEDPAPGVADAAADAIGKMGAAPETITQLARMLSGGSVQTRRASVTVLGWLESPLSYSALVNALHDSDAEVRQGAIAALAELGDRRAVPAIETCLRDDTAVGVRIEAAYRLGMLGDERSLPLLAAVAVRDSNGSVRRWAQHAIEALSSPAGLESTT